MMAVPRGSRVRVSTWTLHLAAPVLVLWLLLARPNLDVRWQHNLSHFVMVGLTATVALVVGVRIQRDAHHRLDPRLFLVSMAFLAAAGFFGLHALATPTVLVPTSNVGFAVATPVGLLLASVLVAASSLDWDERQDWLTRWAAKLRVGLVVTLVVWAAVSLFRLPPLSAATEPRHLPETIGVLAVVGGALFAVAAVRFWQLHRRRRGAVLLSLLTAWVLLGESIAAAALGESWQLSWWLWHVTMLLAFVFVAYAAWVQVRLEGQPAGLFDGVGTETTAAIAAKGTQEALQRLVEVIEDGIHGNRPVDPAQVTAAVGEAHGLTERQVSVLGEAGTALVEERLRQHQLRLLGTIAAEASVHRDEESLLQRARISLRDAFPGHDTSLVLREGATEPPVDGADRTVIALVAKGHTAGWLVLCPRSDGSPDPAHAAMAESFASQIGLALENRRLYHDLDGLFRTYLPHEVAEALIADPSQANLGGAVQEVTVLFADLAGFTSFSERHTPAEVMTMLNTHYNAAVPAILAEGGTVIQFVGDEVMAVFNTPTRQPDHPRRAARAGLAIQRATTAIVEQHPDWPRFRVGINTGPALVGNVGAMEMRNFTAIGDTTNTAARIQASAEPGTVSIGPATLDALDSDVTATPVGALEMKGKSTPVEVHRLQDV